MITETQTHIVILHLTDELLAQLQPFMAGLDITTAHQCLTMRGVPCLWQRRTSRSASYPASRTGATTRTTQSHHALRCLPSAGTRPTE